MCGIYRCWGRCIGTDKISTHISRGGVVRRACRAHRRVSRRALGLTRGTRPPTRQPALSAHGGPRGQSEQPRVVLHVHQPQPGLFVAQPLDKRCRVARSSRRLQRRVLEGRAGQTIGRKGVEEVLPRRSAGAADEHMRAAPHRLGAAACHAHGELRRVQHLAREQQVARRQRRVAADVVDVGAVKLERHLGRRRADVPQAFDRHVRRRHLCLWRRREDGQGAQAGAGAELDHALSLQHRSLEHQRRRDELRQPDGRLP
mmetsp:Transcript_20415/g.54889  ORF Transcript_20415/g.54889 Transcript_20415/m.54889 type:complete len:258 (+) Transcript_20415:34-807(+)